MKVLFLLAFALAAVATERPESAICTVCARRGAAHGEEKVAAWREHRERDYAFCSNGCAEAFDQMPDGYADPVLPRPAPEASLLDVDDEPIGLLDPNASVTIVDFWATWCAPCIRVIPELEKLHQARTESGVRVIGVSIDEDEKALRRFLRRAGTTYPMAHDDEEDALWWAWQVPAVPAMFLLDGEGQIVAQWSGEVDIAELRSRIDAELAVR